MESRDLCKDCGIGRMKVDNTITLNHTRRQYLRCPVCNATGKCSFKIDAEGRRVLDSDREELLATIARQAEIIERLTRSRWTA